MSTLATEEHFTPDGARIAAAGTTINIGLLTEGHPAIGLCWD